MISPWRIRSAAAVCVIQLAITAAIAESAEFEVPLDLDYLLLDAGYFQGQPNPTAADIFVRSGFVRSTAQRADRCGSRATARRSNSLLTAS